MGRRTDYRHLGLLIFVCNVLAILRESTRKYFKRWVIRGEERIYDARLFAQFKKISL